MKYKRGQKQRYRLLVDSWKAGEQASLVILARDYLADFPDDYFAWSLYGIGLYEIARYDESRKVLLRSIKLQSHRNRCFVYSQMGHLYRDKGDFRNAAIWYRKAVKEEPDRANPRIFLGAVLARLGQLNAAEKVHRRATQCKKGCVDEAWLNLGLIHRAKEKFQESLACFEKAIEIDPEYVAAKEAKADVVRAMKLLNKQT